MDDTWTVIDMDRGTAYGPFGDEQEAWDWGRNQRNLTFAVEKNCRKGS